jgi:integrase
VVARRTPHIKRRHNRWFAVLDIPEKLRPCFGGKTRFVQTLETDSARVAARRVGKIVDEWQRRIDEAKGKPPADDAEFFRRALRNTSGAPPADNAEFFRRALRNAPSDAARSAIMQQAADHADAIGAESVEHVGQLPSSAPEAVAFFASATGTPTTAHLDAWLAGVRTTPKTRHMQKADVQRFAAAFPTLADVTKPAVKRWTSALMTDDDLSAATVARSLSSLRSYWRHLASLDLVAPDAGPFTGLDIGRQGRRVSSEDKRQPFAPADVVRLLHASLAAGDDQLAAMIEMAMWTGARIEELAQLQIADLTDRGSFLIRGGKSDAAVREVPIHTALAPVLEVLIGKRRDGYLLVSLTPGTFGNRSTAIGKRFGRLKAREGFGPTVVFHSIRKCVATLLENAGVAEKLSAAILGHEHATSTYGLYSGGPSLAVKAEAIAKLTYPS